MKYVRFDDRGDCVAFYDADGNGIVISKADEICHKYMNDIKNSVEGEVEMTEEEIAEQETNLAKGEEIEETSDEVIPGEEPVGQPSDEANVEDVPVEECEECDPTEGEKEETPAEEIAE